MLTGRILRHGHVSSAVNAHIFEILDKKRTCQWYYYIIYMLTGGTTILYVGLGHATAQKNAHRLELLLLIF
jgi:hypothetical protein